MGMFFSGRDWETSQDQGKDERAKYRKIRTSDWGDGSPSNRTTTLSTHPRQRRSGFGTSSPSNLTALERLCREEWEKLPKYRCAKLVASYPRRLEAVIAAKRDSTKY